MSSPSQFIAWLKSAGAMLATTVLPVGGAWWLSDGATTIVTILAVLITLAWAIAWVRRRREERPLRDAAGELGLDFHSGLVAPSRVFGELDQVPVEYGLGSPGAQETMIAEAYFCRALPGGIEVGFDGTSSIPTGDVDFDLQFAVQGDAMTVLPILDPEIRRDLLDLAAMGGRVWVLPHALGCSIVEGATSYIAPAAILPRLVTMAQRIRRAADRVEHPLS